MEELHKVAEFRVYNAIYFDGETRKDLDDGLQKRRQELLALDCEDDDEVCIVSIMLDLLVRLRHFSSQANATSGRPEDRWDLRCYAFEKLGLSEEEMA